MDYSKFRKNYSNKYLLEKDLNADPFEQLRAWIIQAEEASESEPNAMVLATATPEGKPSSRTVLLKELSDQGLVFFTNYESRKAKELMRNPWASVTFYWSKLSRQVNVEGTVTMISKEKSETYFQQRPRGSQLGSWASKQGKTIASRHVLEEEFKRLEKLYEKQDVPLPPFWGGFCLFPQRFEFWQGQQDRLHDRLSYTLSQHQWIVERLSP